MPIWQSLVLILAASQASAEICGRLCDNVDSRRLANPRMAYREELFGREILLFISEADKAGYARINNGDPSDEVWLDRSWDGGVTMDEGRESRKIQDRTRSINTPIFNMVDGKRRGSLRACGSPGNLPDVICTPWFNAKDIPVKSSKVCGKFCDNVKASSLTNPRVVKTVQLFGRDISLFVSDVENAGFARISNGQPADEVWLDRSWDRGKTWSDGSRLGFRITPKNARGTITPAFNLNNGAKVGALRACGGAGNQNDIVCTEWHIWKPSKSVVCDKVCDNDNSGLLTNPRLASSAELFGREILLFVSDVDVAGLGRINNGDPTDEVWIDRSWDGGETWKEGSRLGYSVIPDKVRSVNTAAYNINDGTKIGVIRVCGKAGNRDDVACTDWYSSRPPNPLICNKVCDYESSNRLNNPRVVIKVELFGREISVFASEAENAAFGRISNGQGTDEVWIDRSWDDGRSWNDENRLGFKIVSAGARAVNTPVFNINDGLRVGAIRACGGAGSHNDIACIEWYSAKPTKTPTICSAVCDNDKSERLTDPRLASNAELFGRKIEVYVSDKENAGFAKISNGDPLDEVWLDRSWDGGRSWSDGNRLGFSVIPAGERAVSTPVFNIDDAPKIGTIRACGKAGNRNDVVCTLWHRVRAHSSPPTEALVCGTVCDNDNFKRLINVRTASTNFLFGREISLLLSDEDNAGYARINNGDPGDEVWVDRSWNGGRSWTDGNRLGKSAIPANVRDMNTPIYNIDSKLQNGALRACGKAGNRPDVVCTLWHRANAHNSSYDEALICDTVCDNDVFERVSNPRTAATQELFGRKISLHVSDEDNAGFASIANGKPEDEVWVDRSWNGGGAWDDGTRLGQSFIPANGVEVNTPAYNFVGCLKNRKIQAIRACGKVSFRNEEVCTSWHDATTQNGMATDGIVCANVCDNSNSGRLTDPRTAHSIELSGRSISVLVSDKENAGFASINNGEEGDEVWLDRSWNGGRSWDDGTRIAIPIGTKSVNTPVLNIDGSIDKQQIGLIRACGKSSTSNESLCTPWTRSTARSSTPAEAAATSLMMDYNKNGLWESTGWWNSANCLTAIIDYMKATKDFTYMYAIDNTHEKNKNEFEGEFCNDYMDDTGWWGLAWVNAYDLSGNQIHLNTAKIAADYMHYFTDNSCGGGVYWSDARTYKNAITNELFIKLTAAIHNRIPGDQKFLNRSLDALDWFYRSGMINYEHLVNDGLDLQCENNKLTTWTYNQGVILGGLVELNKATHSDKYLNLGRKIADAVVKSPKLSPKGILHEPCSGMDCNDAHSYKGAFARNLAELNAALDERPYQAYIAKNAKTIHENRNSIDQYGFLYEGPWESHSAATQQSALDMLTAALR